MAHSRGRSSDLAIDLRPSPSPHGLRHHWTDRPHLRRASSVRSSAFQPGGWAVTGGTGGPVMMTTS